MQENTLLLENRTIETIGIPKWLIIYNVFILNMVLPRLLLLRRNTAMCCYITSTFSKHAPTSSCPSSQGHCYKAKAREGQEAAGAQAGHHREPRPGREWLVPGCLSGRCLCIWIVLSRLEFQPVWQTAQEDSCVHSSNVETLPLLDVKWPDPEGKRLKLPCLAINNNLAFLGKKNLSRETGRKCRNWNDDTDDDGIQSRASDIN